MSAASEYGGPPRLRIRHVAEVDGLSAAFDALTTSARPSREAVLSALDAWGARVRRIAPFVSRFLAHGSLQTLVAAPNPSESNLEQSIRVCPVGVVGHWTAGNVPAQAILSAATALLGGNRAVVRVSGRSIVEIDALLKVTDELEATHRSTLARVLSFVAFDRGEQALHEAMARRVDGAMIWGGADAVAAVRRLPFPAWARIATFGPRVSWAVIGADALHDELEVERLARRLARETWWADQAACSSPQVVLVEHAGDPARVDGWIDALGRALERQASISPPGLDAGTASAVVRARMAWALDGYGSARHPLAPTWTLLVGHELETVPGGVGHRVLHVVVCSDLEDTLARADHRVQTLGVAGLDADRVARVAGIAGPRGVDRIVPLGQMHAFSSPWDGWDLVRSMQRSVHIRVPRARRS